MPAAPPVVIQAYQPHPDISQLPQAVADYRALVQDLLDHHVKVVYVVYPLFAPVYAYEKQAWAQYLASVRQNMPAAPLLDFNAPEYGFITENPVNYVDEIHMSAAGSAVFTPVLNEKLHEALKDR